MPSILARLIICLAVTPLVGCAHASATDRPDAARVQTTPCIIPHSNDGVFGLVKLHLRGQGYSDADIELVTDPAICAAGVAAYNHGLPPGMTIQAAYIIRRGTNGFVLVSPAFRDTHRYYTASWQLEGALQGH
jgi:hypothetical protein